MSMNFYYFCSRLSENLKSHLAGENWPTWKCQLGRKDNYSWYIGQRLEAEDHLSSISLDILRLSHQNAVVES